MRYHKYISIFFLTFLIISCTKESPDINRPDDYVSGTPGDIFESFWNGMNNNYVFWDIDPTDWDQVYEKYKPLFAKLNFSNTKDINIAYNYFKEMTANIVDSHYAILFNLPSKSFPLIMPSLERKIKETNYHEKIKVEHFYKTIPDKYNLKELSIIKHEEIDYEDDSLYMTSGIIDNDIIYLYFSDFKLKELYNIYDDIKKTLDNFFNHLNNPNIKGVIIDVRGNGGGYLSDLDFLIGRMIDKKLTIGYTRSKEGNNRLDYSPWIPYNVTPQLDSRKITAPIVILADSHSVSMSEITTMAVKALPNGHFIGERTWGGNGPLTNNVVYNGGQFKGNSFFKLVYTSSLMFKDNKGTSHEGVGLSPDIEIRYDKQALDQGKDSQLNRALELIQTGK